MDTKRLNKKIAKALNARQIAFEPSADDDVLLSDLLIEQNALEPSAINVILE